jgi:hypothetical protein
MPSKRTRLKYLLLKSIAWAVWVPLAGSLRHDRTIGELKRLTLRETIVKLAPLCLYVVLAVYAYQNVPGFVIYWMAVSGGAVSALFLSIYLVTSVVNRLLDWRLYRN